MNINEIVKLATELAKAKNEGKISFSVEFKPLYDGWQIMTDDGWDAITHGGSYGHENGLIETYGLDMSNMDWFDGDSICGWLTADDILNRLKELGKLLD